MKDEITFKEEYHDNGQLRYKHKYLNGDKHGEQICYHDNGKLWYKRHYLNGKEHVVLITIVLKKYF